MNKVGLSKEAVCWLLETAAASDICVTHQSDLLYDLHEMLVQADLKTSKSEMRAEIRKMIDFMYTELLIGDGTINMAPEKELI